MITRQSREKYHTSKPDIDYQKLRDKHGNDIYDCSKLEYTLNGQKQNDSTGFTSFILTTSAVSTLLFLCTYTYCMFALSCTLCRFGFDCC